VSVNLGSTMVIHAITDNLTPDVKKRIYYKDYLGDMFLIGGATNAGTLPLNAMCSLFNRSLQELDKLAEEVCAGCDGLFAQPEWMGTRVPDFNPNVRGNIIGLTLDNCRPGNIYRAFLEGNAMVLDEILMIIEDLTRVNMKELRICGGGAKSNIQNTIFADVTEKIVRAVETNEPAIGSAILALWGANNKKGSIVEIAEKIVKIRKTFTPDPMNFELYRDRKEIFRKLKRLYLLPQN
ncbi:MAG: FGGY-family carbohydrate kinase, partial [Candidatus Hodarchaeota archaeon]